MSEREIKLKEILKEINAKMSNNQQYMNSGLYLKVSIALIDIDK